MARTFATVGVHLAYSTHQRSPHSKGWPARTGVALVLAVAVLGLVGCSVKARDTMSARSLETDIGSQLAATYHIARPPVQCPSAVPAQVDSRFTCTVSLDRQVLTVDGEVTGPRGQVEVRPASAVVVTSNAETQIADNLEGTFHQRARVSCSAPALLVARPGRTFDCQVDVGAVRLPVVVTVTSLGGALHYRVLPARPAKRERAERD
jgi:hypothetical protein